MEQVKKSEIPFLLETIVIDISMAETVCNSDKKQSKFNISVMNKKNGFFTIEADAIVLAMGCRERPRGSLNIAGYRPAGIYTAGTAQRFVNIEGRMPGKEVVILGSGDIGIIMARRMTLEGAKVKMVVELMPYSGGLKRNIVQCLDDFGIPLKLSHTVVNIEGKERVTGVTLAKVDANLRPIPGTEEFVSCDTLLLSVGLIPENELSTKLGVALNPVTSGPIVDESLETSIPGVFACGNVLHVHDLVDYVSREAMTAGRNASFYVQGKQKESESKVEISADQGIRYTVPSLLDPHRMEAEQIVRFRVSQVYKNVKLCIYYNNTMIKEIKKRIMTPGEMEEIKLRKENLNQYQDLKQIKLRIEKEAD
jgi:thioredoxin reductase